jgi:outer membrane protein OmpA-like peptidoglycan-associated protein
LAYIDAIKTYERIANKGYKSVELFERLGNAYYFNGQLAAANKWYTELMALNQTTDAEYFYRYSQTLKSVGDYRKSDSMLAKFNEKSGNDERSKLFQNEKDYLATIKENSGRYKVQNLKINSANMDYGSTIYNNQLVFASAIDMPGYAKREMKWVNQPFTNLYAAKINTDGTLGSVKPFSKKINGSFDEATPVFTKDGKTMYFTRSNSAKGSLITDEEDITRLKIYKSEYVNNKWQNAVELPFNRDDYSVAHPALSPDEKTLYFSSDMPGTLGDSDIFKVALEGSNGYGTPQNIGNGINTPGREAFPFVTQNNEMYFSTDGRPGMGGLDIYVSKINPDNSLTPPINIGSPVNEKTDDFAFYLDSNTRKGYFSSNRENGLGYDDIYSIEELEQIKIKCEKELVGIIIDADTNKAIPYARIVFLDSKMAEITQILTNKEGAYKLPVECGQKYYVRTINNDYETKEVSALVDTKSGKTVANIAVGKQKIEIKPNIDIAQFFKIKIIYFDLDKSVVRQDAAYELEKILDVMKQNPTIKVDVRSHTDSRQTTKYNTSLSDRRAKATIEWLVKNGIDRNRLSGKGYGESQLVNNCGDGVKCSETEHQANRRSEFIVLSVE